MLKPGGMLFASLTGKSSVGTVACSFVVKDGYRLNINPKPDMDLPLHVRSNREVLELLSLFTPVKSFLYQNGLREYLFRHDRDLPFGEIGSGLQMIGTKVKIRS